MVLSATEADAEAGADIGVEVEVATDSEASPDGTETLSVAVSLRVVESAFAATSLVVSVKLDRQLTIGLKNMMHQLGKLFRCTSCVKGASFELAVFTALSFARNSFIFACILA